MTVTTYILSEYQKSVEFEKSKVTCLCQITTCHTQVTPFILILSMGYFGQMTSEALTFSTTIITDF